MWSIQYCPTTDATTDNEMYAQDYELYISIILYTYTTTLYATNCNVYIHVSGFQSEPGLGLAEVDQLYRPHSHAHTKTAAEGCPCELS